MWAFVLGAFDRIPSSSGWTIPWVTGSELLGRFHTVSGLSLYRLITLHTLTAYPTPVVRRIPALEYECLVTHNVTDPSYSCAFSRNVPLYIRGYFLMRCVLLTYLLCYRRCAVRLCWQFCPAVKFELFAQTAEMKPLQSALM